MTSKADHPVCVMVGPGPDGQGGMSSVVQAYEQAGLFADGRVVMLPSYHPGRLGAKLMVAINAFFIYLGILLRGHAPVLHVHVASGSSFWRKAVFIWMAWLARRRIIFHLHSGGFKAFMERLPRFFRAIAVMTIRRSDHMLCLSSPMQHWLSQLAPGLPVSWWPNPVSAELNDLSIATELREPVVLFLGTLTPDKGVKELMEAFVRLHKMDSSARLVIGGLGPEQATLKHIVVEQRLEDNVLFLGWIGMTEKMSWLARARVLVLASYVEAQPMVLLEAMANGVAVVSTEAGGIPDLIANNIHGLLVPPRDVNALSQALNVVWQDVRLRQCLVTSAWQLVSTRHKAEQVCAALHELYLSIQVEST